MSLKIATAVYVMAAENRERFVSRITRHHAEALLRSGQAIALGGGGVIKAIQLAFSPMGLGSSNPYYEEILESNPRLPMLKRLDLVSGAFVRW